MYNSAPSASNSTGNGDYASNSDALSALAAIAFSDGPVPSTTIADMSMMTMDMAGDGQRPMSNFSGYPSAARASCPEVSSIKIEDQHDRRPSCPAIEITPAEPNSQSTMMLMNGSPQANSPGLSVPVPSALFDPGMPMDSLIANMPSSASDWSDVTSEGSTRSYDEQLSPYSEIDFSDELSALSDDEPIRHGSKQYLSVPLRSSAPKPAVTAPMVPSKYDWPLDVLESSRQEFTRITRNGNLTPDQIDDLRKARRRHKNRRYQKGARTRRKERRDRGLEPTPVSASKLRQQMAQMQSTMAQMQTLCQDMMSLLQQSNPQSLQELREKHAALFTK
eukprot:TRINITY_DN8333_c0_g1_i2.p1 TRINITY_DN8333_c0_g1~~TRINITY_DN8333_c0_g1_i2.p1  ORF type:complete len:334 (+),score=68.00 TRINITY_DN8333_c0_g1_i2:172-1173(+)